MIYWIEFIICASLIVYSGSRLSKYGDIIAEKTGLGRTWIGFILLASVTSLPELITGISSVTFAGLPDIAVGGVVGSCVFNMVILAMLDAMYRPMPLSTKAHQGNILAAAFGTLLLSLVAGSLIVGNNLHAYGWIGPYSLVFVVIYLIAIKLILTYEKKRYAAFMKERLEAVPMYKDLSKRNAFINFGINALVVIIAAVFLPKIGEGIAADTGLGQTFVGNIFIAIATSLPEIVVSVAAVRIDAVDMAIGNLFGSNIFNIFILAIDDMFFLKGPILSYVDANHIIPTISAITMTTIAIIGLVYRAGKKPLFLAWDSIGIVIVFLLNMMLLYMMR